MLGMQVLDLVIGLVFVYFMLSLVCSAVQEIIANARNLRFRSLESWLLSTLQHQGLGQKVLAHPLVKGLTPSGKPSYIPSEKFAHTVLDLVHSKHNGDKPFEINSLRDSIEHTDLLSPEMKRFVLQSIMEAKGEVANVRNDIAKWYDESMERVGGLYKKYAQRIIIVIAVAVSFSFNADTIQLAKFLYQNPEAARELADQASHVVADSVMLKKLDQALQAKSDTVPKASEKALSEIHQELKAIRTLSAKIYETKLPLGWRNDTWQENDLGWLEKIAGLLLTAMAVSLGTPFWFDVLSKLANLRNAGNKPKAQS